MIRVVHAAREFAGRRFFFSLLALSLGLELRAQTIWNGPVTNFTQSANSLTDVLVPGAVSLTRAYSQWLFNPAGGDQGPGPGTPTDTEWAFGSLVNYAALGYQTFDSLRNGDLSALLVGHPIHENAYLSVTFTAWPQNGGFFAYTRSTPALVAPMVSITNPVNGETFAAPASVKLGATATTVNGSVSNVAFFVNGALFGSSQTAPFNVTDSSLAAGSYALTAVATAGGRSVTSAVVQITVVTPVSSMISSPKLAGGQFSFVYSANPGLSYVVQTSSNLADWFPLATNSALGGTASFTNTISSTEFQFFRVARFPRP
jgi:hypothetical protein